MSFHHLNAHCLVHASYWCVPQSQPPKPSWRARVQPVQSIQIFQARAIGAREYADKYVHDVRDLGFALMNAGIRVNLNEEKTLTNLASSFRVYFHTFLWFLDIKLTPSQWKGFVPLLVLTCSPEFAGVSVPHVFQEVERIFRIKSFLKQEWHHLQSWWFFPQIDPFQVTDMMQFFAVGGFNFFAQNKEIGADSEGQQGANSRLEVSPAASRVVGGRMLMAALQTPFWSRGGWSNVQVWNW